MSLRQGVGRRGGEEVSHCYRANIVSPLPTVALTAALIVTVGSLQVQWHPARAMCPAGQLEAKTPHPYGQARVTMSRSQAKPSSHNMLSPGGAGQILFLYFV